MNKNNSQSGFLRLLLIIVVAWALLSYFHVDVRGLVTQYLPWLGKIASSAWYLIQSTWQTIKS